MKWRLLRGDVRETLRELPDGSVQTCVTSPPYWGLRDYGHAGQIGLERTPEAYVAELVSVFREVRRVLKNDGTVWMNLGDSYARMQEDNVPQTKNLVVQPPSMRGRVKNAGLKPKDLVGVPWRVAFALQADGWYLRSDIIWSKPNPMPESVTDRPTKAHEYIFLLVKSQRYFYDAEAIAEALQTDPKENYPGRAQIIGRGGLLSLEQSPSGAAQQRSSGGFPPRKKTGGNFSRQTMESQLGYGAMSLERGDYDTRNARTVWTITTQPYPDAHFATFPEELPERCIKAGSRIGDTVLDPFAGSGTTGRVALRLGREFIGCELNPEYVELARKRIGGAAPLFTEEQSA